MSGSSSGIGRKDFCMRLAALVAAPARALAAGDYRFRYILASPMYGKAPLAEIVPEVPKIGAGHLDIWPAAHGNQREQLTEMGEEKFAALLVQHGVKLGCITRYDLGPFGLKEELALARRLGAEVIVTGAKGPKNLAGEDLKRAVREFAGEMMVHVEEAERRGVTIAIENHSGSLLHSADSMRYFAEASVSPRLGLAFAPHHLPQDGAMQGALVAELGPAIKFFYAQGAGWATGPQPKGKELMQMPGRGPLDFGPSVAALKKMAYGGFVEIFMHPFPRGIPILEPASAVTAEINRSREYLEKMLAGVP
ncbi:MAG TPA: TIM barrel protein [Verrucomicrobiae bacterium]|nr:TIM barrel protein [Verrucomicrobiae bacterium]